MVAKITLVLIIVILIGILLILAILLFLILQNRKIMNQQEKATAAVEAMAAATTTVGNRMQSILDKLRNKGLTEDQENALFDKLAEHTAALVAMGDDIENPVPVVPEGTEGEEGTSSPAPEA